MKKKKTTKYRIKFKKSIINALKRNLLIKLSANQASLPNNNSSCSNNVCNWKASIGPLCVSERKSATELSNFSFMLKSYFLSSSQLTFVFYSKSQLRCSDFLIVTSEVSSYRLEIMNKNYFGLFVSLSNRLYISTWRLKYYFKVTVRYIYCLYKSSLPKPPTQKKSLQIIFINMFQVK